jgi:predicted GIY-YIG superfamily endonuclease
VKATKASRPWKIIHSEKFKIREEAITRERYLKSGVGREWMDGMNL